MKVSAAYSAVIDYAIARGARDLKNRPGCWEAQIDDQWWIAVNGHPTPTKCSNGYDVQPYDVVVEFNGWPAGSFNAAGGIIAAGSLANEESLLEAIVAAGQKIPPPGGGA